MHQVIASLNVITRVVGSLVESQGVKSAVHWRLQKRIGVCRWGFSLLLQTKTEKKKSYCVQ